MLVQDFCYLFVVERFPLHDVAPVAGAVTDRQEDQLVILLGLLKGLRSPRMPVGGIVGVHQKIRAGLLGQAVSKLRFFLVFLALRRVRSDPEKYGSEREVNKDFHEGLICVGVVPECSMPDHTRSPLPAMGDGSSLPARHVPPALTRRPNFSALLLTRCLQTAP